MRAANLGLRFVLELCLLAALAYVGLRVSAVLVVVGPGVAALVWALFVSPRARYPLSTPLWLAVQVVLFGCAVIGLVVVGSVVLGVVFAVAVALNLALVLFWRQRDTVT